MQKATSLLNSVVVCRSSQDDEITANTLKLRRYSVAFEVYNPFTVLQFSEVLRNFRIRLGDRIVYQGEAVVAGIVNTGTVMVCEATLGDSWVDVDFLSDRGGREPLSDQLGGFLQDWKRVNEVDNAFKLTVADMQNLLTGLQRWMEQIDLGIRGTSTADRPGLEREVIGQLEERFLEEVGSMMTGFEDMVWRRLPEGREATHKYYVRRQVHPLVMCSPFCHRCFHKPLGYAGDYEMVNMMVREPFEGGSLFAKMLNHAMLRTGPVIAHRNRIEYLSGMLHAEAERNARQGRRTRVLNLGCGPAHEVQRFLRNAEASDLCEFTLLDFNEETVNHARRKLSQVRTQAGRVCPINLHQRSVHQLLRQSVTGDVDLQWESYDVVYCAGLFDYLSQRVCGRLTELLVRLMAPGGLLVITNVSPANPSRAWMEFVVEWNLIYRDRDAMADLAPRERGLLEMQVGEDPTGVNLFLEIRKCQSAHAGCRR